MARITTPELAQKFIDEQVALVREQVKDKKVLLALSGGVDSSVVAALLIVRCFLTVSPGRALNERYRKSWQSRKKS